MNDIPLKIANPWVEGTRVFNAAKEAAGIPVRQAEVNAEGLGGLVGQGLHLPTIQQSIVESPFEGFPMRTLLTLLSTPTNNSVMIPKEQGSRNAVVTRVAEGAEIPLNFAPYEGIQCTTYKIGEGFIVSSELQRYQQARFIEQKMRHLAFKMKHTENVDIITVIGAAVPAANVVAAGGISLGQDGTQFVLAGTIGQYDILNAKRLLRTNFKGNTSGLVLLVNAVGEGQLNRLPMYKSLNQYGSPLYKLGFREPIEGCQVITSEDVPAGTAYMIATDPLSYPTGQYTPVGYFIESRPMETTTYLRPDLDGYMVYAVHEYTPCITFAEGIVQITYSGSS